MAFTKKNVTVMVISLIAVLLIGTAAGIIIFRPDETAKLEQVSKKVPTPNQLLYQLEYQGEVKYSFEKLEDSIITETQFYGYELKDEYCMVYQIRSDEEEKAFVEDFGIQGEIAKVDYEKNYLLLAIGKKISDMKTLERNYDEDGSSLFQVDFEGDYAKDNAYIYSMSTQKMVSGVELELYYWQNTMDESNLTEDMAIVRKTLSKGSFYKIYRIGTDRYEYILYSLDGMTILKRDYTDVYPVITEITNSLVKVVVGDTNFYFNPTRSIVSEIYDMPTRYLVKNIITYVRSFEGEIQLILRDAYDKTYYAKIVRLPFTFDEENLDSLVRSITVIDDTHVLVEYYSGENRVLTETKVEVHYFK